MAEDERKSENMGYEGGFAAKMGRLRRAIPTLDFLTGGTPWCGSTSRESKGWDASP
jgi:hypothetical protein